MALMFHQNTKSLFSGSILRMLMDYVSISQGGPWSNIGITIYSGVAPTPAQVASSWSSYNSSSSSFLVHFTNSSWDQPSVGPLINISTYPTPQNAVNSGIATWAIIWAGTNPSSGLLAGTTLPTTKFIIVSVSAPTGDGVIRLASTSLVSGNPVSIQDGTMSTTL